LPRMDNKGGKTVLVTAVRLKQETTELTRKGGGGTNAGATYVKTRRRVHGEKSIWGARHEVAEKMDGRGTRPTKVHNGNRYGLCRG